MTPDNGQPEIYITCDETVPLTYPLANRLLLEVEKRESVRFELVELVYVDQNQIQSINRSYLDHDYVTDIITFRLDDREDMQAIEATIYCCAHRITEQAVEYGSDTLEEFRRVFVHGLLHLAGYNDQTSEQRRGMRSAEDHYLNLTAP